MNQKILIIDDDSRNIFALVATLRSEGWKTVSCTGAAEGLLLIDKDPEIAMVLIDMMMPDMDGYEAIPLIRKLEGKEKLPVIAVTAQAMAGDREKCLAAGADDYISKPINVEHLLEILNRFLKK